MTIAGFELSGYAESQSGLPIEYERDYGTARGNAEVPDIFDNPVVFSPLRRDGLLAPEESSDFIVSYAGTAGDDLPHPLLV